MSQTPVLPPNERRILRLEEVEAKSGFKRAHIYNLMKKRQFPQALRLGVRASRGQHQQTQPTQFEEWF